MPGIEEVAESNEDFPPREDSSPYAYKEGRTRLNADTPQKWLLNTWKIVYIRFIYNWQNLQIV